MNVPQKEITAFQKVIWNYYKVSGRGNLPWRKNINPYKIWVSEIMLQQTRVDRVVPFFKSWIKAFPTVAKLANASQVEILKHWKGLGYNSRALRMKQTAQEIVKNYQGKFPKTLPELEKLPGIGPYTAGAICAFADNQPVTVIETNIRRVFIHHFFYDKSGVHDDDILELVKKTLPENVRGWYWALMDYGSFLGRTLNISGKKYNPNVQSKHYTKQSKFSGSDRQIRGKILEILLQEKNHTILPSKLYKQLQTFSKNKKRIGTILVQMENEKFLEMKGGKILLKN